MIQNIKRLLSTGFAFGFSKSAVFIVPLFLSNVLTNSDYGLFESCLAYGGVLAVVLGGGVVAAVPYFMLVKETTAYNGFFYLHGGIGFLLLLILALVFAAGLIPAPIFLIMLFAIVMNWQRIFATDMKTRAHATYSSFSESFLYIVILLAALWNLHHVDFHHLSISLMVVLIPLGLLGTVIALRQYPLPSRWQEPLKEIYTYALPTVIPSLTLLSITSLVRLIAPFLVGPEKLAIYAFYFRFASISVVLYQFLATLYFAMMYKKEPKVIDGVFSKMALLIFVISGLGALVFPQLFAQVFKLFETFHDYWPLYLILVFFCFFWVSEAMLEPIIFRECLANSFMMLQATAFGGFLLALALVYFLLPGRLDITMLAYLHTLLMATIVALQLRLLRKNGIDLPRFIKLNALGVVTLLVGYPLMGYLS